MKTWSAKQRFNSFGSDFLFLLIQISSLTLILSKLKFIAYRSTFDDIDDNKEPANFIAPFILLCFGTWLSYRLFPYTLAIMNTPRLNPDDSWINKQNKDDIVLYICSDQDQNGALAIETLAKKRLRQLHQKYSIIFREIDSFALIKTISECLKHQGKKIKVLIINAHANRASLSFSKQALNAETLNQYPNLFESLEKNATIILQGCETDKLSDDDDSPTIASEISRISKRHVFASKDIVCPPLLGYQFNAKGDFKGATFYKFGIKNISSLLFFGSGEECTSEFNPPNASDDEHVDDVSSFMPRLSI